MKNYSDILSDKSVIINMYYSLFDNNWNKK